MNIPNISAFSSTVEGDREVSPHSASPVGMTQGGPHRVFGMHDPVFKIAAFAKNALPFAFSSVGVHGNAVTGGEGVSGERWPGFLPEKLYREVQAFGYKGGMPESFHVLGTGATKKQLERVVFDLLDITKQVVHEEYSAFAKRNGYSSVKDIPEEMGRKFDSITEIKSKKSFVMVKRLFDQMSESWDSLYGLKYSLSVERFEVYNSKERYPSFHESIYLSHFFDRVVFLGSATEEQIGEINSLPKKIIQVYFNEALSDGQRAKRLLEILQGSELGFDFLFGVGKMFKDHISAEMLEKTLSQVTVMRKENYEELREVFSEKRYDGVFQKRLT